MSFLHDHLVLILNLLQFLLGFLIDFFQLVFIDLVDFGKDIIFIQWSCLGYWGSHWLLVALHTRRHLNFMWPELLMFLLVELAICCFNSCIYHFEGLSV